MNFITAFIAFIIFCGPATYLLLLGIWFLPFNILHIAKDTLSFDALNIMAIMTITGTWGLTSLLNLAQYTLISKSNWPGSPMQWIGVAMGLISCTIGIFYNSEHVIMIAVFIGPIFFTTFLLCISKFGD